MGIEKATQKRSATNLLVRRFLEPYGKSRKCARARQGTPPTLVYLSFCFSLACFLNLKSFRLAFVIILLQMNTSVNSIVRSSHAFANALPQCEDDGNTTLINRCRSGGVQFPSPPEYFNRLEFNLQSVNDVCYLTLTH